MTDKQTQAERPEESGEGFPGAEGGSPVMAQLIALKEAHPDSLLFFRMGDFYELFFDDAVKAATALGIALTKRGKHRGEDIPMCGVPAHSHESYLHRLIAKGYKVAICEQLEDPSEAKKRGSRALVRREVVRVVTPGTLTEEALLDARRSNFLAALARAEARYALAWLDVSTGAFAVEPLEPTELGAALARLGASEILLSEALLAEPRLFELLGEWKARLTPQPARLFDSEAAGARLKAFYGVAALDAFGPFGRAETAACGALIAYIELTQKGRLPRLAPPAMVPRGSLLAIDPATRRNLELTESLSGARAGSLLDVIDRTVTGAGGRLLRLRLTQPSTDVAAINRRLDAVDHLFARPRLRAALSAQLRKVPDIERALSRLSLGRGGPRDLAAMRDGLARIPELRRLVAVRDPAADRLEALPALIAEADKGLGHHAPLVDRLSAALLPEPPSSAREGGFIAKGYSAELDEFRTLRDEGRRLIATLEARYREESGIASLKIRHNNVLGYFIEVPSGQAAKMGEPFIHRQTLASAVRYASVELSELEEKIGRAAQSALALELALFADLVAEVVAHAAEIAAAAGAMAELDVETALAALAAARDYVRPVVDESTAFRVEGGRHPVVEAIGEGAGTAFVANDCDLSEGNRLWLLTGPNMAGKSTFLRQNALIALLAQAGSFVPAKSARIGVVDKLFSRVGASDDLARGRSTFMVEMIETAAILNQATPRSLVILDEIGRGTATFDGLSIAWATVEHLHEVNRCRALFATHFHELTLLAQKLAALACHTMRVKEWKGDVVFLHEVTPGVADRSYGIHVAKLAGLPAPVLARAEEVLAKLEEGETGGAVAKLADDLPLFAAAQPKAKEPSPASALEEELRALDADTLSPRAALELIYRLKAKLAP